MLEQVLVLVPALKVAETESILTSFGPMACLGVPAMDTSLGCVECTVNISGPGTTAIELYLS